MSKSSVILPQRQQKRFDPSPNQKAIALTPQQNPILRLCRQKTCKLATSFLYQADHPKHLAAFRALRREHGPSFIFKLPGSFIEEMRLGDYHGSPKGISSGMAWDSFSTKLPKEITSPDTFNNNAYDSKSTCCECRRWLSIITPLRWGKPDSLG